MASTISSDLEHLADDFFRARRRRGMMAAETERSYGQAYLDFSRFLEGRGVVGLPALDRDLITDWVEGMAERGNSAATRSLRGTALRRPPTTSC